MKHLLLPVFLLLSAMPIAAQGTNVAFGSIRQDTGLPVEVTADNLSVDQGDGSAVFTGKDAAESERADYDIDTGTIVMSGNVLLTQGRNALSSDTMSVKLSDGTAQMSGRVKTILQTGSNN